MSRAQSGRIIIAAMIVLAIAAAIETLSGPDKRLPSVRVPIAIVIVGVLLTLAREASPELAGAFGTLLIISATLTSGRPVWDALTRVTGGTPS